MSLRGADQFPFILTSDGSMDVYPENKTSNFCILLREPLNFGDEDWEVCLANINYPHTWTNLGPAAKVSMKYYVGGEVGCAEINFPNWYCGSMEEVIRFMNDEVSSKYDKNKIPELMFVLDHIGRVKIKSTSASFDIGFSDNMLKLLGLAGNSEASLMQMETFEKRQTFRERFNLVWRKPFPYYNRDMVEAINACKDSKEFMGIIEPYIDPEMLLEVFGVFDESTAFRMNAVRSILETQESAKDLMMAMKVMYDLGFVPPVIKAVTPGVINPVQRMFVYLNIIEPVDMNNKFVTLLKVINTRGEMYKTTQEDFVQPMYMPVRKGSVSMMKVLLADENGDPIPFQMGTVVLTLHFRKVGRRGRTYL